ncbi:hypothetical protein EX30DRAFT_338211 [Ascodesmis nigricans]|uniref:Uncharacterized protein n=1 Tax=Ascodesmis nigricans TaxID=341454 RepID=A0A4S2N359_9PEZI|nr:hypothetical protein EX30DRAFT_338211 [Ascodesmis nigricans]
MENDGIITIHRPPSAIVQVTPPTERFQPGQIVIPAPQHVSSSFPVLIPPSQHHHHHHHGHHSKEITIAHPVTGQNTVVAIAPPRTRGELNLDVRGPGYRYRTKRRWRRRGAPDDMARYLLMGAIGFVVVVVIVLVIVMGLYFGGVIGD